MNTKIQESILLALLLKSRAPETGNLKIVDDCAALRRLASRATSRAVAYCNGVIDSGKAERQSDSLTKKADTLLLPYGLHSRTTGDPRGFCLRLHALPGHPELKGNTWGGDDSGYGV